IAVYAADPAATERFYVHDLGATKGLDPESGLGVRYYFSVTQFVEVLPLPKGPPSINPLDHIAFTTTPAAGWFEVQDPEGNRIQFLQSRTAPTIALSTRRFSAHIIHVGFIVH